MQDFFSNSPDADKLRKVQAEINEVKSTMVENIGMPAQCMVGSESIIMFAVAAHAW